MIVVLCPRCHLGLRTIGLLDEVAFLVGSSSEFWPDKYTCPRCEGAARGALEADVPELHQFEVRDLSVQELYAALNGLGLPEERACTLELVNARLHESPVKRLVGVDIPGTDRCVLRQMELVDGTRFYFGAGPEGAVIYRHVPPQKYMDRV